MRTRVVRDPALASLSPFLPDGTVTAGFSVEAAVMTAKAATPLSL